MLIYFSRDENALENAAVRAALPNCYIYYVLRALVEQGDDVSLRT